MKAYFEDALRQVLDQFEAVPADFAIETEVPNNPEHGDLSTNTAMRLAGVLKQAPRQIAEELIERLRALPVDRRQIAELSVAGPGFINVRYAGDFLHSELASILKAGEAYGRTERAEQPTAVVEYVSANPTGPLTVGHGRNAVLGDTVANLLEWTGYEVTREYYFNDAGRQMRVLGASVRARYLALCDPEHGTKTIDLGDGTAEVPKSFPEDGYMGSYIEEVAQALYDQHGAALCEKDEIRPFKEAAEKAIFAEIEQTLERLNISMDVYYNEHTLHEEGRVDAVVETLREKGYVYEKEGAVWFKTSEFGKTDADGEPVDTVLVKSSGEATYRLPDIAYHETKFERGYDRIVDVFGADHIAAYPDVVSALDVLGYDTDRIDVLIYQFVTLVRGGKQVKMSTRRATYETLDELMDTVGEDVTRFFFLMRSPNTHLDFDLDLAEEASEKNPVFYLQYAHARICSILRKAEEEGFQFDENPDLTLLTHEAEEDLIKVLLRFPEELRESAEHMAPHSVVTYLREVAVAFTRFYGHCHILGEDAALASARMALARATRQVLRNGLHVLGISAPEQM